jgi:hypothetical protein
MPTSDANPSNDCPSTAVIHRPFGGVLGYRRISDRAIGIGRDVNSSNT